MVNYGSLNFLFTVFQTQILILWSRSCPLLTMVGWTHKAQFHPENSIQAPFSIMVSSWNLVGVRCSHLLAGLVWSNSLTLWPCSRPEAVLQSLLPMVWKYFWQPHRNAPWAVCDGKWLVMCWLLPGVFVRSFNFLRFATKWFSDTLVFQQKKKVEEEKKKTTEPRNLHESLPLICAYRPLSSETDRLLREVDEEKQHSFYVLLPFLKWYF